MAALRPALREARRLGDRGLIPNIIANIAGASNTRNGTKYR